MATVYEVIRNPKLSRPARLLFAVLISYANGEYYANPSRERLRANLGYGNVSGISRLLTELENANLVRRIFRQHAEAGYAGSRQYGYLLNID